MQFYRDECIEALNSVVLDAVKSVSDALLEARDRGASVFVVGNGGSAATASHMATDLMLGSGLVDPPLRVIALTDNTNFRAFWYGTNRILTNAIYLSDKM